MGSQWRLSEECEKNIEKGENTICFPFISSPGVKEAVNPVRKNGALIHPSKSNEHFFTSTL
jgi:hypothetical protein